MKYEMTYCNPLPLLNYQRGRMCFDKANNGGWLHDIKRDFREMADPTVIKFKDRWYLFPSCGMLWYSDDMINWVYHPIEPFDPGYAPTVVQKGDDLYLTACDAGIWRASDPLGEWMYLGDMKDEKGKRFLWSDPMLFVDDDGWMYCYHGLGSDGIYVVRLRSDDVTEFDGPRINCFAFDPEHVWERVGEHNQDNRKSYIEGAWMTKHNGRYYLQYSGPGTEWRGYSVGCYMSTHPMGPFEYQDLNPILKEKGGLVHGCGHHSMVEGPNGTLWCFYTTLVRNEHVFERRIGMDPAGFDEMGRMFVKGPTETPQWAPGLLKNPEKENSAGLVQLNVNRYVKASSYVEGREPVYGIDNNLRTWWQAEDNEYEQWIRIDLDREYLLGAARTIFSERGLDYDNGIIPGTYKYRIEGSHNDVDWFTIFDAAGNKTDKHICYDTWEPAAARYVRLVILKVPKGLKKAVLDFTVFGSGEEL